MSSALLENETQSLTNDGPTTASTNSDASSSSWNGNSTGVTTMAQTVPDDDKKKENDPSPIPLADSAKEHANNDVDPVVTGNDSDSDPSSSLEKDPNGHCITTTTTLDSTPDSTSVNQVNGNHHHNNNNDDDDDDEHDEPIPYFGVLELSPTIQQQILDHSHFVNLQNNMNCASGDDDEDLDQSIPYFGVLYLSTESLPDAVATAATATPTARGVTSPRASHDGVYNLAVDELGMAVFAKTMIIVSAASLEDEDQEECFLGDLIEIKERSPVKKEPHHVTRNNDSHQTTKKLVVQARSVTTAPQSVAVTTTASRDVVATSLPRKLAVQHRNNTTSSDVDELAVCLALTQNGAVKVDDSMHHAIPNALVTLQPQRDSVVSTVSSPSKSLSTNQLAGEWHMEERVLQLALQSSSSSSSSTYPVSFKTKKGAETAVDSVDRAIPLEPQVGLVSSSQRIDDSLVRDSNGNHTNHTSRGTAPRNVKAKPAAAAAVKSTTTLSKNVCVDELSLQLTLTGGHDTVDDSIHYSMQNKHSGEASSNDHRSTVLVPSPSLQVSDHQWQVEERHMQLALESPFIAASAAASAAHDATGSTAMAESPAVSRKDNSSPAKVVERTTVEAEPRGVDTVAVPANDSRTTKELPERVALPRSKLVHPEPKMERVTLDELGTRLSLTNPAGDTVDDSSHYTVPVRDNRGLSSQTTIESFANATAPSSVMTFAQLGDGWFVDERMLQLAIQSHSNLDRSGTLTTSPSSLSKGVVEAEVGVAVETIRNDLLDVTSTNETVVTNVTLATKVSLAAPQQVPPLFSEKGLASNGIEPFGATVNETKAVERKDETTTAGSLVLPRETLADELGVPFALTGGTLLANNNSAAASVALLQLRKRRPSPSAISNEGPIQKARKTVQMVAIPSAFGPEHNQWVADELSTALGLLLRPTAITVKAEAPSSAAEDSQQIIIEVVEKHAASTDDEIKAQERELPTSNGSTNVKDVHLLPSNGVENAVAAKLESLETPDSNERSDAAPPVSIDVVGNLPVTESGGDLIVAVPSEATAENIFGAETLSSPDELHTSSEAFAPAVSTPSEDVAQSDTHGIISTDDSQLLSSRGVENVTVSEVAESAPASNEGLSSADELHKSSEAFAHAVSTPSEDVAQSDNQGITSTDDSQLLSSRGVENVTASEVAESAPASNEGRDVAAPVPLKDADKTPLLESGDDLVAVGPREVENETKESPSDGAEAVGVVDTSSCPDKSQESADVQAVAKTDDMECPIEPSNGSTNDAPLLLSVFDSPIVSEAAESVPAGPTSDEESDAEAPIPIEVIGNLLATDSGDDHIEVASRDGLFDPKHGLLLESADDAKAAGVDRSIPADDSQQSSETQDQLTVSTANDVAQRESLGQGQSPYGSTSVEDAQLQLLRGIENVTLSQAAEPVHVVPTSNEGSEAAAPIPIEVVENLLATENADDFIAAAVLEGNFDENLGLLLDRADALKEVGAGRTIAADNFEKSVEVFEEPDVPASADDDKLGQQTSYGSTSMEDDQLMSSRVVENLFASDEVDESFPALPNSNKGTALVPLDFATASETKEGAEKMTTYADKVRLGRPTSNGSSNMKAAQLLRSRAVENRAASIVSESFSTYFPVTLKSNKRSDFAAPVPHDVGENLAVSEKTEGLPVAMATVDVAVPSNATKDYGVTLATENDEKENNNKSPTAPTAQESGLNVKSMGNSAEAESTAQATKKKRKKKRNAKSEAPAKSEPIVTDVVGEQGSVSPAAAMQIRDDQVISAGNKRDGVSPPPAKRKGGDRIKPAASKQNSVAPRASKRKGDGRIKPAANVGRDASSTLVGEIEGQLTLSNVSLRRNFKTVAFIFVVLGFSFSVLSNMACMSIKFVPANIEQSAIRLGLFTYQLTSNERCVAYPTSVAFDTNWKTARVLATGAMVLGIASLLLWIVKFLKGLPRDERFWSLSGVLSLFCFSLQGSTFLFAVGSACSTNPAITLANLDASDLSDGYPNHCEWDIGSIINILSTVLWWSAGVTSLLLLPPQNHVKQS